MRCGVKAVFVLAALVCPSMAFYNEAADDATAFFERYKRDGVQRCEFQEAVCESRGRTGKVGRLGDDGERGEPGQQGIQGQCGE